MESTRGAAATTLTLLGLAASACTSTHSSQGASSTTLSEPSAPSATADGTPSTRDPVLEFVPSYVRMLDDLRSDPMRPLDDIYEVAVAPEATAEASAIGRLRSQEVKQTGQSQLVTASRAAGSVTSSASSSMSPGVATVVVNACVDVSRVGAVDKDGKSVLPTGRPTFLIDRLTVVNPRYPDPASWRVSSAGNRQAQSCNG